MVTRREFAGGALAATVGGGYAAAAARDIVMPLQLNYGVLWAPVLIDGRGPHRFIVDTGQTFFHISSALAEQLHLRRRRIPQILAYTPDGQLKPEMYVARDVLVGGAYHVENIELFGRSYNGEEMFNGIVPFMASRPVSFDFRSPQMTLHAAGLPSLTGASRFEFLPPHDGILSTTPVVMADLDGMPLKLLVSTGSAGGLDLYPATVQRLDLWDRYSRFVESKGADGEIFRREVRAASLRFGGVELRNPVAVLENPKFAEKGEPPPYDGTVGMDVLRRFQLGFDSRASAMWFTADLKSVSEPFAYNRSGFNATRARAFDTVAWVQPGGPADKAGLRLGDRIPLTAEERFAFNYALRSPAEAKVQLNVLRDGKPQTLHLTLEELI